MDDIAHQVDRWVEEARHQTETARERQEERQERAWEAFADRLGDLKRVSITSGLKSRVEQLLRLDGQTDAASQAARVARLYGKQSRVAHRGRPVSNDELFELDEIVRRTLIAAMRREEASSPG